ncbi:MAG: hypothetical protein H0V96_02665 [Acidimicrobiia bacterium]|nr:hypothetical protein [Acidimicrobiia bacterium]
MSTTDIQTITDWFGRQTGDWTIDEVTADADEILVVLEIGEAELAGEVSDDERAAARKARVSAFREETRGRRMEIAAAAQSRFGCKVSWGVRSGDTRMLYTHMAIPAMTRLRVSERRVLDTLVEAGVARSRSHALAWCVRLVGKNLDPWLAELREALVKVDEVRQQGPVD